MPPAPKIIKSFVSNHLAKEYYTMAKSLDKILECSICLEQVDCKHCFCLLSCGHGFHIQCIAQVQDHTCPLCRS